VSNAPRLVRAPDRSGYLPTAITQMADQIAATLVRDTLDEDLLIDLCIEIADTLYVSGHNSLPSAMHCRECLAKYQRDSAICEQFNGHNYDDLAERHHVSERTVRRIINLYFYQRK